MRNDRRGKIINFSQTDGTGTIMTVDDAKIEFSINDWKDYKTLPSFGLEVKINNENEIVSLMDSEAENSTIISKTMQKARDKFIDRYVGYGYTITSDNDKGFSMHLYEKEFSIMFFLGWTLVFTLLLFIFLGPISIFLAMVISIFLSKKETKDSVRGTVHLEKEKYIHIVATDREQMYITDDGKLLNKLPVG